MSGTDISETRVGLENVVDYASELLSLSGHHDGELETSRISLPYVDIIIRQPASELAKAIDKTFIKPAEAEAFRRTLEVTILHAGLRGVPVPRRWGGEPYVPHHVATAARTRGLKVSFFPDLSFWQAMSASQGLAVQVMTGPNDFPPWETGAPLRVFMHWFYAALGKRLVHAGTVGFGGRGALLAGAGGSGKSGTVVAALLSGLDSVGDDYVLVDLGQGISAKPLYSTLKQDPAGYIRLGLPSRLGEKPLNWQGKHQFSISDVSSREIPSRMPLDMILLPRTGASHTHVKRTSAREVLMALAPSALHQMPGEREEGFRFFSMLAKTLPGYILHLGTDPEEIADGLRRILMENSD